MVALYISSGLFAAVFLKIYKMKWLYQNILSIIVYLRAQNKFKKKTQIKSYFYYVNKYHSAY